MIDCIVTSFFFQAEDGIRDLVRSRGLGDVYKRQRFTRCARKRDEAGPCAHFMEGLVRVEEDRDPNMELSLIHI